MEYCSVGNQCPKCNRSFRTLEDEYGTHDCPYCGYSPHELCDQDFQDYMGERNWRCL